MEISKVIGKVISRFPLFGKIIASVEVQLTTLAEPAPAFTDGKTIYYKNEFFEYSDKEQEFIISHEIMHIVLNHIMRNVGKDKDLLNFVEDAIINQLLARDGLEIPEGLINITDALNYSVEELYMKYLPYIKEIKNWMGANTYHLEFICDLEEIYNTDLQELMNDNMSLREASLKSYKEELENQARVVGNVSYGLKFPSVAVGLADSFLNWKALLKAKLKVPDDDSVSFYEIDRDGIIRKETKDSEQRFESEIVIDSSGSMSMTKIKVILRECKNILSTSELKVGFCDTEFYGWNEIKSKDDIDKLNIIGRGGTSFFKMAGSFSHDADNKIVITDGYGYFPPNDPDILWVIISDSSMREGLKKQNIDYVFISENGLDVPPKESTRVLKR